MKKDYEKKELLYAIVLIIIYCASTIPIRGSLGDGNIIMLSILLLISSLIICIIKKNKLEERYGLSILAKLNKKNLYFIPLIILATGNLWGGLNLSYNGLPLIYATLSMAIIGFIEELIFRGFLFKALESKISINKAIIIVSAGFGLGHIVNLFAGQEIAVTIAQVIFEISMGFIFTYVFLKTKSIWPCILLHSIVNVLIIYGNTNSYMQYIYIFVTTIVSFLYCLYLSKYKNDK